MKEERKGGSEEVGLAQRGQGPSHVQIAHVPSQKAHLDPAVLSGHLVHLPSALNVSPFHREEPHVGAARSHVSAPPAQVLGSVRPMSPAHPE